MASAIEHVLGVLLLVFIVLLFSPLNSVAEPIPADWPEQFHSVLFMNRSETLQKVELWYDWPNGRNFNILQDQLSHVITYDLEWNNGTSFIYTLHPSDQHCEVLHVPVGILRPNWLDGATYLGYTAHVMTFEVGAVLEDPNWQAPVYCFNNGTEKERSVSLLESGAVGRGDSFGRLMRGTGIAANAAETL